MTFDRNALAAQHDHHGMAQVIEGTPSQIEFALSDPAFPKLPEGGFDEVIVVGMGGSSLPVDVLTDTFADQLRAPVRVCRHYEIPSRVNARTLVVASSFSGNTEETLAPLEDVGSLPPNVVVITAGGRLAEIARDRSYPLITIPKDREPDGFQPRCATGYFVTYLARLLAEVGVMSEDALQMVDGSVQFLRDLDVRGDAEEAAQWIGERIALIYTDQIHEASVGRITKIKLNEHAKRPAFYNALPEANHNETIGMSRAFGQYALLYMKDPASHARVHQRFDVMRSVFADTGLDHVDFREWTMPGETRFQKVFAALTFGDWCSYTVALLDGIDPTPVKLVEDFKKALENVGS